MHRKTEEAALLAEDRLLDLLLPNPQKDGQGVPGNQGTREKFRQKLRDGLLDEKQIDLEVAERGNAPMLEFMPVSMND
ncbi:MAG: HslU--HslV peptidase ATPase subunit, partial [Deltaproteobacteria bacterium]